MRGDGRKLALEKCSNSLFNANSFECLSWLVPAFAVVDDLHRARDRSRSVHAYLDPVHVSWTAKHYQTPQRQEGLHSWYPLGSSRLPFWKRLRQHTWHAQHAVARATVLVGETIGASARHGSGSGDSPLRSPGHKKISHEFHFHCLVVAGHVHRRVCRCRRQRHSTSDTALERGATNRPHFWCYRGADTTGGMGAWLERSELCQGLGPLDCICNAGRLRASHGV